MLIVTATNVTPSGELARPDGTADYDIWIGINHGCIWRGSVNGHVRDKGAAELLRLIADRMDATKVRECTLPPAGWRCTREPGHENPCAAVPA